MAPVIGLGMTQERNHAAPVGNSHGFSIEWLRLPAGGSVSRHSLAEKQVLIVYRGAVEIAVEPAPGQAAVSQVARGTPEGWDSFAMPADCPRSYKNTGNTDAMMLLMTPGDGRKTIHWSPDVVTAAGEMDRAVDANGFVGLKRLVG